MSSVPPPPPPSAHLFPSSPFPRPEAARQSARRSRRWLRWLLLLGLLIVLGWAALMGLGLLLLGPAPSVPKGAWLEIDLAGPLPESPPDLSSWRALLGPRQLSAQELMLALRRARDDRRIAGVLLCPDGYEGGWAQAEEVRQLLSELRAAGKPVWAYVGASQSSGYYLASVAGSVAVAPEGGVDILGLQARMVYLRGSLDKLGVDADFIAVGEYKSAPETFTRTEPSEPARRETSEYLDDLYDRWLSEMASGRGMTRDRMAMLVDRGSFDAAGALAEGLADTLLDPSTLWQHLQPFRDEPQIISPLEYLAATGHEEGRHAHHKLALLYATGTIVSGSSGNDGLQGPLLGSDTLIDELEQAAHDDDVEAVVLRVDSPGGSALASDLIDREVQRVRQEKPVVVSMGNVAASGGYYISLGADRIVADRLSLTGSIGVYAGKFDVSGLYDRLGVSFETLQRGENADLYSELRPFSPEQRDRIQSELQAFYQRFVARVADARGLTPEAVDAVAQGRVWSGAAALKVGLVDQVGSLEDAIQTAKQLAGLASDVPVGLKRYQPQPSLLQRLAARALRGQAVASLPTLETSSILPRTAARSLGRLRRTLLVTMDGSPQYHLPWLLRIQ